MKEIATTIATYAFIPIIILTTILLIETKRTRYLLFLAVVAWIGMYGAQLMYYVQQWNVFHYWLNSRYISELGYEHLYDCALKADDSLRPEYVRDLNNYEFITAETAASRCPQEKFSPQRWESFTADFTWLRSTTGFDTNYWLRIVRDKGLNTTPTWIAFSTVFATVAEGGTVWFWLFLYADFLFLVVALGFVGFAYGLEKMAVLSLFLLTWIGTFQYLMGHWWQYSWFAIVLLGMVAWKKKAPFLTGSAFAFAAALRLFPAVLFLWPLLHWKSISRKFWYGAVGTSLVAFFIGMMTPLGWRGWLQFFQKMIHHSNYIVFEPGNFGVRNVFFSLRHWQTATDNWEFFTEGADVVFTMLPNGWTWIPALLICVVAFVFAWRVPQSAFSTGLPLLVALFVVTPYYYVLFGIYFLEEKRPRYIQMALLISLCFYLAKYIFPPIYDDILPQIILGAYIIWFLITQMPSARKNNLID